MSADVISLAARRQAVAVIAAREITGADAADPLYTAFVMTTCAFVTLWLGTVEAFAAGFAGGRR